MNWLTRWRRLRERGVLGINLRNARCILDHNPRALFPQVQLVSSPSNLGFASANNLAAQQARGEFFLLLNPDTTVPPGALTATVLRGKRHSSVSLRTCQWPKASG